MNKEKDRNSRSMNNNYKYKASIIVPIYNVEKYLPGCFESLEAQTINNKEMEVLLIVDGSPDNSLELCQKKAEENNMYKVFWKENEGLSATRNFGIRKAQGKYIMFLDPDDTFEPQTVKNVVKFFDHHYEEVDVVTFPMIRVVDGERKQNRHFRYTILQETGVYDLREFKNWFITQTTINVCVKNQGSKNILFDETKGFRQEDQKYNFQNLKEKMKIGFVADGGYLYLQRSDSIVQTYFYPYYIFESSTKFWEEVFASFPEGQVPEYFQSMLMWDLNWKMKQDIILPYHYDKEQYDAAIKRLDNLLQQVSYRVIANHPGILGYHRCYWLSKLKKSYITTFVSNKTINIFAGEEPIFATKGVALQICKLTINKGELYIVGFAKSAVFSFVDSKPVIKAIINDETEVEIETFPAAHSFLHSGMKNQNFPAFKLRYPVDKIKKLAFKIVIEGKELRTRIFNEASSRFVNGLKESYAIIENYFVTQHGKRYFTFTNLENADLTKLMYKDPSITSKNGKYSFETKEVNRRKKEAIDYRSKHNVWLYYDLYTVTKDNGYYQFIHDFGRDDVERYYVYNRPLEDIEHLFTKEQKQYLVEFGSEKHILLYLSAKLILTGYFGWSPLSPFESMFEENIYKDVADYRVIYLQHGILHADLFRYNNVENGRIDKIVISSYFEKENYTKKYNYDECDLIESGMPRYDHIDFNRKPERRILFAPSWRKYLTSVPKPSHWNLEDDKLLHSNYYKGITEFLTSEKLARILEENDLYLDFKPHPIIANTGADLFNITSDRIQIIQGDTNVENYIMFITDFSSYVFDYACLDRPIAYYVPDYVEFRSGMNHYRKLDLPYDEAFGNFYTEASGIVDEIGKTALRDFIPEKKYSERMKSFYLPLGECEETIYQECKNY